MNELGALTLFSRDVFRASGRWWKRDAAGLWQSVAGQIVFITTRSMATVLFSGVFVGAILVLQFNFILVKFDAQILLGGLNTSAVIREIGPLIISFLLAGKIGAFTAAELGTMRVTEQIDAVECLGVDPLEYLIVPRYFGILGAGLILLILGVMVSILGSMAVASLFCGLNPLQYLGSVSRFSGSAMLWGCAFKSITYSLIVATVCCYRGYSATGGARGVGQAVTQASLYTNLYIVLANYITTQLLELAHALLHALQTFLHPGSY